MIQKMKRLLTHLAIASMFVLPTLAPVAVHADCLDGSSGGIGECLNSGAERTDPNADPDPSQKVNDMIRLVINIFSLVVGVIAVIMIIIGGLKYITSGGDSGNITGAKNTILYAIIGLIVVALAQIIVRFVLTKVTEP